MYKEVGISVSRVEKVFFSPIQISENILPCTLLRKMPAYAALQTSLIYNSRPQIPHGLELWDSIQLAEFPLPIPENFISYIILSFFLPKIIFLIEGRLQCCVGFSHTVTQVIHNYVYIISFLSLPPLPPSQPSRSAQIAMLGFLCYTATSHQLSILHMVALHTFFFKIN